MAAGGVGRVRRAETPSPSHPEPAHPDLCWHGAHGCESLCTVMGLGCVGVKRGRTGDGRIMVAGDWGGGRAGVFREENGRDRKGCGGRAAGEKGGAPAGAFDNCDVPPREITTFFQTGKAPVTAEETMELHALMEAADESNRRGGAVVTLKEAVEKARK